MTEQTTPTELTEQKANDEKLPAPKDSSVEQKKRRLWAKLRSSAVAAGSSVIRKVLVLYYAARDNDTPAWARATIWGAIAYFVAPIDGIPDLAPFLGYSDDLTVLAGALATVAAHIKESHKEQAEASLNKYLGEAQEED